MPNYFAKTVQTSLVNTQQREKFKNISLLIPFILSASKYDCQYFGVGLRVFYGPRTAPQARDTQPRPNPTEIHFNCGDGTICKTVEKRHPFSKQLLFVFMFEI